MLSIVRITQLLLQWLMCTLLGILLAVSLEILKLHLIEN